MNPFDLFGGHPELAKLARPFRRLLPVVLLLSLAGASLEGVGIGLLIPLLSTLTGAGAGQASGFIGSLDRFGAGLDPQSRLFAIAAAATALIALKGLVQWTTRYVAARIEGALGARIRSVLAERLIEASYLFHLREDASRLLHVISTESWRTSDAVHAVLNRLTCMAVIAIFTTLLLVIDWQLTLMVVAGALLFRLVRRIFVSRLRRLSQATSAENEGLAARMLFVVHSAKLLRLLGQQRAELTRFNEAGERVRRKIVGMATVSGLLPATFEVLHTLLFFAVMIVGIGSGRSLAAIATFLVLLNRLQPYLRGLEESVAAYASATGPIQEVESLLQRAAVLPAPRGTRAFAAPLREGVTFRKVGFSYDPHDSSAVLRGVDLTIRSGRSTAILGRSGAGKSTLLMLLCRLLDPTEGDILVDGVPLREIDPASWLAAIGIAGQDIDLIDGSIADNITYGGANLSREDIEAAALAAHAHAFIEGFPAGYETRVGARGTTLSGGQRQRLGIARALARKPSILILDEATNAVDAVSEKSINEVLASLAGKMTIVVVSHRASSLALCDDGIVIENGAVRAAGLLTELGAFAQPTEPA